MRSLWSLGFCLAGCPSADKSEDTGTNTTEADADTDSDADADADADVDTGDSGDDPPPEVFPNDGSPLGMNLDPLVETGEAWVFVDLFKQSSDWIAQTSDGDEWDTGEPLMVDEFGWVTMLGPGQAAATVIVTGNGGLYPSGEYTLLYEGEGTIELYWDAISIEEEPGRHQVDVSPSDAGIYLKLVETNPEDPVRNIRFIMPGFEESYETDPFHPVFVTRLEQFTALRFMPWQRTNEDPSGNWSVRTTPEHARQTGPEGVALEYMIDLANRLHADPWFCMPHRIDDESVYEFASMVRSDLDRDLDVYIEYSNEIWNNNYPQGLFAEERGVTMGLSDNAFQARLRYQSQRSVEIARIWSTAWMGSSHIQHVLSGQSSLAWTGAEVMEWQEAWEQADFLAIAPYFGQALGAEESQDDVAAMSMDEVFSLLEDELFQVADDIDINATNAHVNGLELIAYEGGQHLVGIGTAQDNEALNAVLLEANRDPRMGELYTRYLDSWRDNGGELFMNFAYVGNWSEQGYWGALEYQIQDISGAPKMNALIDFIDDNWAWWVTGK